MAWYKDKSESIGCSDIATLLFFGLDKDYEFVTKAMHYGGDGRYKAYIVNDKALIPDHYKLEASFEHWLRIYDDDEKTLEIKADHIEVYRSGDYGTLIYHD